MSTRTATPAVRVMLVPTLEVVRRRALELVADGSAPLEQLAQLVGVDPVLTGAVLRAVQCPVYGLEDAPVELARSMRSLGRDVVELMLETQPTPPMGRRRETVERACTAWIHSLAVATAARWLANAGAFRSPADAFVAGLVHDVGRLADPDDADPSSCTLRTEWLLRRCRMSDAVVAVALSHRQVRDGLPAASLGFRGRPLDDPTRRLLEVVARADALASAAGYDDGAYRPAELEADLQEVLPQVAESIRLELAHAGALLDLAPCDPAELLRVLTERELRAGDDMSGPVAIDGEQPDLFELAALHGRLLGRRSMGVVNELLESGLRDIRDGLDLDRVMLFESDPDGPDHLRGRVVIDGSEIMYPRGVHGVQLPYEAGSPLATALDKGVAVIGGASRGGGDVADELGVDSFVAAPLSAGNATFGIVVADRFFSSRPVESSDAATLGLLCDTLGLVLENMALDCQGKTLRSLAEKDELTGINNRRNIVSLLEAEIRRSRRFGTPLSVALLDVDFFKKWNDVHGHQTGDQVLKAVAQIIASCSREVDHYGRYGGEEFLVVLPETPIQHAVLYAERLRVTLQSYGEESLTEYAPTTLTLSVGLTSLDPNGDDVDRLVQRADSALYAAKKHGRNRVCVEAPARPTG